MTNCDTDCMTEKLFKSVILNYLNREMQDLRWEVSFKNNKYTLSWQRGAKKYSSLQLAFIKEKCLWKLYKRGQFAEGISDSTRIWTEHIPDRRCLSLSDWLVQVRKLITKKIK